MKSRFSACHNCQPKQAYRLLRAIDSSALDFQIMPLWRHSKDVYLLDEVVPRSVSGFLGTFFNTVGTVAVIVYSTPLFITVFVPVAILYYFVQVNSFVPKDRKLFPSAGFVSKTRGTFYLLPRVVALLQTHTRPFK